MLPAFVFDRYIDGVKMAEGVRITREHTLEDASAAAARIARKGDSGQVPVLIFRADLSGTN